MSIFKQIVTAITGLCISNTIGRMITNAANDTTKFQKVATYVTSFVVGGMLCDAASTYIEKQIDETVKQIQSIEIEDPEVIIS